MKSDRLRKLQEFYNEEPNNPFLIYGLAMEYEKIDLNKAIEYYLILLEDHPDYLPTYYQLGHIFWEQDELEKAEEIFKKGISLAQEQKNQKTLHELKSAHVNLQMEM